MADHVRRTFTAGHVGGTFPGDLICGKFTGCSIFRKARGSIRSIFTTGKICGVFTAYSLHIHGRKKLRHIRNRTLHKHNVYVNTDILSTMLSSDCIFTLFISLDLTWSWFYFSTAAVCPSSWGRQHAANTSNTWYPGSSVLWIDYLLYRG